MAEKQCTKCGETKPVEAFSRASQKRHGRDSHCKQCRADYQREYRRKNPQRNRDSSKRWRDANKARYQKHNRKQGLKKYGLDQEAFDKLLREQDGRCAICRKASDRTLHVDHDHVTGKVRGLLCTRCNPGLGYFQDDPALCRAAADYLEATSSHHPAPSAGVEPCSAVASA